MAATGGWTGELHGHPGGSLERPNVADNDAGGVHRVQHDARERDGLAGVTPDHVVYGPGEWDGECWLTPVGPALLAGDSHE